MQNFGHFCTTPDFDREYLRNEATYPKSETWTRAIPPAFDKQTKMHFLGDYISASGGAVPWNFYTRYRLTKLALIAHTQMGTEVPPQKKIDRENLNFGLKFSVLAPVTSGLMGVSSCNFSRQRSAR